MPTVKKLFLILFCFVYFLSSVGVAVNLHYCGSKFVSASLTHSDESKCCRAKMKKKGCCKEKSVVYKVKTSQDSGNKIFSLKNTAKKTDLFYTAAILTVGFKKQISFNVETEPPPNTGLRYTYLVNRVFRI